MAPPTATGTAEEAQDTTGNYIPLDERKILNKGHLKLIRLRSMPSYAERNISPWKLKFECCLADGCLRKIYLCSYDGYPYAVKVAVSSKESPTFYNAWTDSEREENLQYSPRIMGNPNVTACVAVAELDRRGIDLIVGHALIFEYCDGGNFASLYTNCISSRYFLPEGVIWSWLLAVVNIIHEFHKPRQDHEGRPIEKHLHCDIKPDNVFLKLAGDNCYPILKLGDLGHMKVVDVSQEAAHIPMCHPPYNAPEWEGRYLSEKSELWQLVHIVYMATTLCAPARPRDIVVQDTYKAHFAYSNEVWHSASAPVVIHRIPTQYSDGLQDAFEHLLQKHVVNRPDSAAALAYLYSVDAIGRASVFEAIPGHIFLNNAARELASTTNRGG